MITSEYLPTALQKGIRSRCRLNHWCPRSCLVEEHLCVSARGCKCIPVGCNRGRVNLVVWVKIDDEGGERLREGIDEGCIVERWSRSPGKVIYNIIPVESWWDCQFALQTLK
jgi:hypothetical protein